MLNVIYHIYYSYQRKKLNSQIQINYLEHHLGLKQIICEYSVKLLVSIPVTVPKSVVVATVEVCCRNTVWEKQSMHLNIYIGPCLNLSDIKKLAPIES